MTQLTTEQKQQLKDIVIRLHKAEERIDQTINAYNDALIYRFGKRVSLAEDAYNEIVEEGNKLLATINPEFFSLETAWVRENLEVTLNPPLINWEDLAKKLEEQGVSLDELYGEKQKPPISRDRLKRANELFLIEYENHLDILNYDYPEEEVAELSETIPWGRIVTSSLSKQVWIDYGVQFLQEKAKYRDEEYDDDDDDEMPVAAVNQERLPLSPAPEEFPTEQEIEALRRMVRAWVPEGSSKDFCDGFLASLILYPEIRLLLKPHLVPSTMDLLKDRCESVPYWKRCEPAAE